MCVIVHQPVGAHLTKEDAQDMWDTNPDGGGFAYVDDANVIQVEKHMQFGSFWRSFETARSSHPNRSFLLHMRIATHGEVNLDNVHPFIVDDFTVMAHNGILHGVTPFLDEKTDKRSDTRYFVDEVLPRLPETWLDDPFLTDMVDEWMGWSKLMFLTTNPKLSNKVYRLGKWEKIGGIYMSNDNHLWARVPKQGKQAKKKGQTQPSEGVLLPATSNYQETSADWYDWWLYKESEYGPGSDPSQYDEDDKEFLLEALHAERKSMGIEHGIAIIGDSEFDCTGCLRTIDTETAECGCWDLVCDNCWKFKALCPDFGMCEDSALWEYHQLTETGQEYVKQGGKYRNGDTPNERKIIEKVLANPVPEGA